MHERYFSDTRNRDIALLKLKTKATLGAGVGLVCLPEFPFLFSLEGKACYITGWGAKLIIRSEPAQATYLQEASVPIISIETCSTLYGDQINNNMLCAGNIMHGGVDTCEGDSGGPLVCEFNGKWYLEGAASWGGVCGSAGFPGVYTRVRPFLHWIVDTKSSNEG